jgi:hypothetical protein
VNNGQTVKIEGDLTAPTASILDRLPDVELPRKAGRSDRTADVVVRFEGTTTPVRIEAKKRLNAPVARQIVVLAGESDLPVIAVAEETTADARRILAEHRIGLVDGLGNADLRLPGLWMHLEAPAGADRVGGVAQAAPKIRLSGRTGVAVQALLLEPERPWRVRELAAQAGVSSGLAHRVLARLEDEGLMKANGSGPRKVRSLTDPASLLDLLAEETTDRPDRIPAFRLAQSPRDLIGGIAQAFEGKRIEYALTGAAAASLIAPFISAVPVVELWVSPYFLPVWVDELGMDEVESGQNVELLQVGDDGPLRFRRQAESAWIVNPFRLYIDLLHDPRRGREQAEVLRREVIGF